MSRKTTSTRHSDKPKLIKTAAGIGKLWILLPPRT